MDKDDSLKDNGRPKQGKRPLSILDRSIQAAVADKRELGNQEDPAKERYPLVWEWLTRTKASNDLVITAGKLTITGAPGGFVCQLTHADMCQSVVCTVITLVDLLELLELHLGSPQCVPQSWGKKQPTARRRKPIL